MLSNVLCMLCVIWYQDIHLFNVLWAPYIRYLAFYLLISLPQVPKEKLLLLLYR